MASARGQPLQALGERELNSRAQITPLKSTRKLEADVYEVKAPKENVPKEKPKKKKEKLSALCKTPPSLIKTSTGKDYRRGLFLGEGGFARCFQIKDDSGQLYAAKTVAKASIKNDKTKTKLLAEIKIHKSMHHPSIVQFIDCFEDDINVYILLEICPNQSLMDLLKKRKQLTEPEVRFMMVQIIGGIKYMHNRRVIHRDLKLGNIFFDADMNIKIGDFGLASVLKGTNERRYTICGTPNYIAPEVLTGKKTGHSFEVDIWSIGIMLYALLIGKPPFQSKDVAHIYERIKINDYHFPPDKYISDSARTLIEHILKTVPGLRPSLDDMLLYEFFTTGKFPNKLTVETLVAEPDFSYLTESQSHMNFLQAKRDSGLIQSSHMTPVEILKTDLESEKPKTLLPQSLSPGNTKSKYKEVTEPVLKQRTSEDPANSKLGRARRLEDHGMPYKQSRGHRNKSVSNAILRQECTNILNGMVISERQARIRASSRLPEIEPKTPILISKWVDYSNKHGFSYQLSTDDIGVLFNDGNTLLRINHSSSFWYIVNNPNEGWLAQEYSTTDAPAHLHRHIEITEFFAKYMKTNLCKVSNDDDSIMDQDEIFLRRYTRDEKYVMFEMSNGSVQFNFKDHHKICISQTGCTITYISPDRVCKTLALSQVFREGGFREIVEDIGLEEKLEMIKCALKEKIHASLD